MLYTGSSMRRVLLSALVTLAFASGAQAAEEALHPKQAEWHFDGIKGTFDKQSIQRGYQVYKEVCAACHSMNRVAFRQLGEVGFPADEIEALAAGVQVKDGPGDDGEMFERAGRPSDLFPSPFANEQAARAANGGAYPPDLSLITKARHDGPNYVYSLLTGYTEAKYYRCTSRNDAGDCTTLVDATEGDFKTDADRVKMLKELRAAQEEKIKAAPVKEGEKPVEVPALSADEEAAMKPAVLHCMSVHNEKITDEKTGISRQVDHCTELSAGKYYNPYFPGGQISMAPPLSAEGQVTYGDETKATVNQMAHDVVSFLQWAAEPEMEHRKAMGIKAILFLIVMSGFLYVAKRRIWRDIH